MLIPKNCKHSDKRGSVLETFWKWLSCCVPKKISTSEGHFLTGLQLMDICFHDSLCDDGATSFLSKMRQKWFARSLKTLGWAHQNVTQHCNTTWWRATIIHCSFNAIAASQDTSGAEYEAFTQGCTVINTRSTRKLSCICNYTLQSMI